MGSSLVVDAELEDTGAVSLGSGELGIATLNGEATLDSGNSRLMSEIFSALVLRESS